MEFEKFLTTYGYVIIIIIIIIQFNSINSIQFWFINVPSQQPDGQLQKQHNIQTQITMDKEQNKINKHNKTNKKQTITY
jgi:hypothetical protein